MNKPLGLLSLDLTNFFCANVAQKKAAHDNHVPPINLQIKVV
jgi:hypothetical protein